MALKSIPSLLEEELGLSVFPNRCPCEPGKEWKDYKQLLAQSPSPPADTHRGWRGPSVVSAAADAEGDGETRSLSPTVLKLSGLRPPLHS